MLEWQHWEEGNVLAFHFFQFLNWQRWGTLLEFPVFAESVFHFIEEEAKSTVGALLKLVEKGVLSVFKICELFLGAETGFHAFVRAVDFRILLGDVDAINWLNQFNSLERLDLLFCDFLSL